jgi:hypothetical protein
MSEKARRWWGSSARDTGVTGEWNVPEAIETLLQRSPGFSHRACARHAVQIDRGNLADFAERGGARPPGTILARGGA